jgi:hypothetical protein
MPVISAGAIAGYAQGAGFSRARSHRGVREDILAVAIALGESGGNTTAHNAVPPDNSYGLWQINMLGALGPERRRQFGISSNEALYDPATNARAAFKVFTDAGNSFRPWSVYTSGSYLRHLSAATKGGNLPVVGSAGKLPGGKTDGEDFGIGDFVSFITSGESWLRVALFLGGGVLLIIGVLMVAGKGIDDVASVVPVGRIAKSLRAVK